MFIGNGKDRTFNVGRKYPTLVSNGRQVFADIDQKNGEYLVTFFSTPELNSIEVRCDV